MSKPESNNAAEETGKPWIMLAGAMLIAGIGLVALSVNQAALRSEWQRELYKSQCATRAEAEVGRAQRARADKAEARLAVDDAWFVRYAEFKTLDDAFKAALCPCGCQGRCHCAGGCCQ